MDANRIESNRTPGKEEAGRTRCVYATGKNGGAVGAYVVDWALAIHQICRKKRLYACVDWAFVAIHWIIV